MGVLTDVTSGALDAISPLVERFDPEVIDVPGGRARIRLASPDGEAWDAVIRGDSIRLEPETEDEPSALLEADAPTWHAMASDLRGGMAAFRKGRLKVRHNLHLGVGVLAATSGDTRPGRLEFRSVGTSVGRILILRAGRGDSV